MADSQQPATGDRGITDADRARIAAYLQTPAYNRSIDDLRRHTEQ